MNKKIFIARLRSFVWRLGSYVGISIVAFLGDNVGLWITDPQIVAVAALISGEVTKILNTK